MNMEMRSKLTVMSLQNNNNKTAIIIGAGPAGLTAAYELIRRTDIKPVVFEKNNFSGGISATLNYKGNKIDIGGHRFFTKSQRVLDWWFSFLPMKRHTEGKTYELSYHNKKSLLNTSEVPVTDDPDDYFMLRNRKSRIYYSGQFFDYPLNINWKTIKKLGVYKTIRIGFSSIVSSIIPRKPEKNLEDFFINRFGKELYKTFFKDYTEKVWGRKCSDIRADWGKQRIKGLSLSKALRDALKSLFPVFSKTPDETSLIEYFLYPKYGPGHLWKKVASKIEAEGGEIFYESEITGISLRENAVESVSYKAGNSEQSMYCSYVFSSMPLKELISVIQPPPSEKVRDIAERLRYRDFVMVGLWVRNLKKENGRSLSDNWIYLQDNNIKAGRIQLFENWSEHMVADRDKSWIGMEYFANEGDRFWSANDEEIIEIAKNELEAIGFTSAKEILDGTVFRMPKTYPAYWDGYNEIDTIRQYTNGITNLFPIGRNGQHKYNNQDHSGLSAMVAVDLIQNNSVEKQPLWNINTEDEYLESQ